MNLKLSNVEASLVRQALLDVMVNSPNFAGFEKEYIQKAYRRLHRYEKKKAVFKGWK